MSADAQTLVLNQSYEPLEIVSWKQAITLLFQGKCEVIEEYAQDIRSAYLVIKIPAVVRLLNKIRRHKKPVKFSRVNIYGRDDYKCQYCAKRCKIDDLTYDHVLPRSQGGKTTWTNIASCCADCNTKKGGRTPEQAKMRLLKKPVQPVDVPALVIQVSREKAPEAWRDYLYWTGALDQD